MPCVCATCLQHANTLGLRDKPASKAAIHSAFRAAAKLWHPDRFERQPARRLDAEEHFKQIQVAYRELCAHHENPKQWPVEDVFVRRAPVSASPPLSFAGPPGCFVAGHFPLLADQIIAGHLGSPEDAVAIVDLSGHGSQAGSFSQYLLLTRHGLFVRDAHRAVSLIWYSDLGEIALVDRRKHGKLGFWQRIAERISGIEQKYSLEIHRRDRTRFCSIAGQADDSVKCTIYSFLLERKPRFQ